MCERRHTDRDLSPAGASSFRSPTITPIAVSNQPGSVQSVALRFLRGSGWLAIERTGSFAFVSELALNSVLWLVAT
jgi:hypothetical protein